MLRIMGGATSELEQKHTELTTGLAATFTASPVSQSLPATLVDEAFPGDHHTSLVPDVPSSIIDGTSIASASDVATIRGSWSDTRDTSYEDQLLQHFLTIDPPVALFAPMDLEWKYARPALLAGSRDSSLLLSALYCYADVHMATAEEKRWRFAPTYHKVSSQGIQDCLHGEVDDTILIKILGAVFLLMISELVTNSELCTGTSYLHTGYLILQRFCDRTHHLTGLGHLLASWVSLLDIKSLIAGRDGDPLIELGYIMDCGIPFEPLETGHANTPTTPTNDHQETTSIEDPFRNPNYLVYEAIAGPAFQFFVQAQQILRRIVHIDLHHRSRGTLSDEFEVLQIAHKVGADLELLWQRRPPMIDTYTQPEFLSDTICPTLISEICRVFRQYIANFLASFIYLHRVAFAIYPRTARVNGAVDRIIQLATVESTKPGHLPASFLWPLFIAGLEATDEQRQWIFQEMQRMAAARNASSASFLAHHPTVDKVIVLLEEMARRQGALRAWVDSKCVRRELFFDFYVVI